MSFELPAAIVLVLGGAVACFAGYRLFRIVLAIYGFIAGAMLASSMMGSSNTIGHGRGGARRRRHRCGICSFAYFVGIALVGAGLGALLVHVGLGASGRRDPPVLVVISSSRWERSARCFCSATSSSSARRFRGAWTMILGALASIGLARRRAAAGCRRRLDPVSACAGLARVDGSCLAWIALGLFGTVGCN